MQILQDKPKFDPVFLNAQFDAIIAYMESCQASEYTCGNHEGWKISFKRRVNP